MSDRVRTFLTAQRAFTDRVDAIADGQWQLATPAVNWSVAELVAHLVHEHRWAPPLLAGLDMDAAAKVVDGAGGRPRQDDGAANYVAAWAEATCGSARAFSAEGALQRTVTTSRGNVPASTFLDEMIFELIVHAWDLAQAIGFAGALPAAVVETVWATSRQFGDLSAGGLFDSPVEIRHDAPTIERLVALSGRDPG